MPRKDATTGSISAQAQQDLVSEGIENFELPKSLVTKIAKSAVPEQTKLQKETVLSLVKGSTVFINYLAATAHEVALSKQHKSISASDVLKALEMIEFGDIVDKLQKELQVYRELAKNDKSKKGSSNITNSSTSIKIRPGGVSASAPVGKGKGKEKEKTAAGSVNGNGRISNGQPSLYTSAPLPRADSAYEESISTMIKPSMDVDSENQRRETNGAEDRGEEFEEPGDEAGVEGEEPEDDNDNDEQEREDEGLEDPMEVEEEELRRDAVGLDDSRHARPEGDV